MNTVTRVLRFLWLLLSPAWARTCAGWWTAFKYSCYSALALLAGYTNFAVGVSSTSRNKTLQEVFWFPFQYSFPGWLWASFLPAFVGLAILALCLMFCVIVVAFVFFVIPEIIWPAVVLGWCRFRARARNLWVQTRS